MSKFFRVAARAAFAVTVLTLPALAADGKVTKGALVIDGGQRFFRGKSTNVQLGSYGEKKSPVGAPNYLAIEKNVSSADLAKIPIKVSGPINIDWSKVSSADVAVGGSYAKSGGATASLSVETAKSAALVLVKFSIDEGYLKDLLNLHDTAARSYMRQEGNDARIVSEVYVAMEATLASTVTVSGSATANASASGLEVNVAASGSSTTTTKISLAPSTSFAYLLHKVKNWDGNKITNMEDDRSGIN